MRLTVSADNGHAILTLSETDDMKRLSAHSELGPTQLDRALQNAAVGECDDGHVWISINALRDAGPSEDAWRDGFDAMIRYAAQHGWVAYHRVRIHLSDED